MDNQENNIVSHCKVELGDTHLWALPDIMSIFSLKSKYDVISLCNISKNCVRLTSKDKNGRYRIDHISTTGISTIYTTSKEKMSIITTNKPFFANFNK